MLRVCSFSPSRGSYMHVSGLFVPPNILSRRTFGLRKFCPAGRFVIPDVFSFRTFCPSRRYVPRMLCLRLSCRRTLRLRTFCPSGRYVSGYKIRIYSMMVPGWLFTYILFIKVVSLLKLLEAISGILRTLSHWAQSPPAENETVPIFRIQWMKLTIFTNTENETEQISRI